MTKPSEAVSSPSIKKVILFTVHTHRKTPQNLRFCRDPKGSNRLSANELPKIDAGIPARAFDALKQKVILFTVHYASKAIDILFRQKRTQNRLAAAHSRRRLMLLGSPPDMVHSRLLRRTDLSQPDSTDRQCQQAPSRAHITPAIADFRQQGAAGSPASTAKRITFKCLPL